MVSCKIKGCKNRTDNKARVCSSLFKLSCYKPTIKYLQNLNYSPIGFRTLLPDAVPIENIGTDKEVLNNINKGNIKNICNRKVNNNAPHITPTVLLLLDNNLHLQTISSTPLSSVKYVKGYPNLDVRLERFEAPPHVLDHQYAANHNSNVNTSESKPIKNESNDTNSNISFKIKEASVGTENDQQIILKLNKQLQLKIIEQQKLERQLKRLQKEKIAFANKRIRDVLKNVFSPRQMDKLMYPYKTKIKWSVEDIISAISLQNISTKAYRYLRDKNYPLPGLSTIKNWSSNVNVNEGILTDVVILMKHKAKTLSVFQKIVVIHFDDVDISGKNCKICIVRGLFYKWMQPVYYSFDQVIKTNILKEIITELYGAGYIVVAITCSFNSLDQVWIDLAIGIRHNQKCFFVHPANINYKVFIFPHESCLLRQMKKHFIENGFILQGKHIHKDCIEEIINVNRQIEEEEYCVLTHEIFKVFESDKKNVSVLKNLFSAATAKEITSYGKKGLIIYKDWKETAEFFKKIGDWLDLFNSKVSDGYKKGEEPYGLLLDYQNNILNKVEKLMQLTKIKNYETSTSLQEQIILRCFSLKQLLKYLQESFSIEDFQIKYVLTNRLNSESLGNIITYLSGKDLTNSQVSHMKFSCRLKNCILGKYLWDPVINQVLKISEPCLIDFNERSESIAMVNNCQMQKKRCASETAEKMRKFLTVNNISSEKVHKNLLHIINKNV